MNINVDWTSFKSFVNARNLSIQYLDINGYYYLMIFDGPFGINCHLNKDGGSDVLDFENNFKSAANQPISMNVIIKDAAHNTFSGQKASSASVPVVIASDQSNISNNIAQVGGTNISLGQKVKANSLPVVLPSDQALSIGLSNLSSIGSRTYATASQENITATTTLRTVTAGKTFYLTSYTISVVNTSLLTNARLAIRDNTTVKLPFILPTAAVGLISPGLNQALSIELNPMPFTTNVNIQLIAGTCSISIAITGYEE